MEIEESALDIDWFFTDQKNIGFVASAGGKLPLSISPSSENIQILAPYFRGLPVISGVEINLLLEKIIGKHEVNDDYLSDFIFMSARGLYSFGKTVSGNFADDKYHLVAKPVIALGVSDLPPHIEQIIRQTITTEGIQEYFNVSSFG